MAEDSPESELKMITQVYVTVSVKKADTIEWF